MAKTKQVSFDVTKFERGLIEQIVARAQGEGYVRGKAAPGHWYDGNTATMDLTACHANGCRLDLERLLNADGFNFIHDIGGIAKHMNRDTGQLDGHFRPRFTERKASVQAA
jgi:hypothetical protein